MTEREARRGLRVLRTSAAAFVGLTAGWILVGLLTPGDYHAQGSPFAWLVLLGLGVGAASLGARRRSRVATVVLGVGVALSLLFWFGAPNGWWAKGPPPPP